MSRKRSADIRFRWRHCSGPGLVHSMFLLTALGSSPITARTKKRVKKDEGTSEGSASRIKYPIFPRPLSATYTHRVIDAPFS